MSISKEKHDELCTSYASLALYDGDVSVWGGDEFCEHTRGREHTSSQPQVPPIRLVPTAITFIVM